MKYDAYFLSPFAVTVSDTDSRTIIRLPMRDEADISWPVKIRVRADVPAAAPRRFLIFPARFPFLQRPKKILRTLENPLQYPCRLALDF